MPQCKNCQQNFEHLPGDLDFYKKVEVPEPEMCPDCRQQNRIAWRNFTNLYLKKCELTGEEILTRFSPEGGIKIINVPDWHSDKWNPLDYRRDYDFSRSFFDQFFELYKDIPHSALWQNQSFNCDFTNLAAYSKGCYMVFGCVDNKNCFYSHLTWSSNDCYEALYIRKCELCYEVIDCNESYGLFWCSDCTSCNNCKYCYHCKGCQECVSCYGLINQTKYVLNKPCVNDQDYQKQVAKFMALSQADKQAKIDELRKIVPTKENTIINSTNCTGNYIYHSKNCHGCYDVKRSEDSSYCYTVEFNNDSYDYSFTARPSELSYNTLTGYGRKLICCQGCLDNCNELYYCQECNAVKDCFGCIGLHNKEEYCILNKQYSAEEYKQLKDKIIQQMEERKEFGKFFPVKDSAFVYNESIVNEYYPLTKEQALAKGYNWLDPDPRDYQPQTYQVPVDIKEVKDEILDQILACTKCGRNYKIIKQELNFYRQHDLPIPRECFYCRHAVRMAKRNPRKLFERQCDNCHKNIRTTYTSDRQEKVYCDECFNKEMY